MYGMMPELSLPVTKVIGPRPLMSVGLEVVIVFATPEAVLIGPDDEDGEAELEAPPPPELGADDELDDDDDEPEPPAGADDELLVELDELPPPEVLLEHAAATSERARADTAATAIFERINVLS